LLKYYLTNILTKITGALMYIWHLNGIGYPYIKNHKVDFLTLIFFIMRSKINFFEQNQFFTQLHCLKAPLPQSSTASKLHCLKAQKTLIISARKRHFSNLRICISIFFICFLSHIFAQITAH